MFKCLKWRGFNQAPPLDRRLSDSYFERLLRYVPADIVAAWVTLDGIFKSQNYHPLWLSWGVFGVLTFLTPLYIVYIKTEPQGFLPSKTFHWMAATFSFGVWVFALGGPFPVTFQWYQPVYGSVLLVLTTLFLPVLETIFYRSGLPPLSPVPPRDPNTPVKDDKGESKDGDKPK